MRASHSPGNGDSIFEVDEGGGGVEETGDGNEEENGGDDVHHIGRWGIASTPQGAPHDMVG